MEHTKGPWVYDQELYRIISGEQWMVEPGDEFLDGIHTTVINTFGGMGGDDTRADIALICAAPDLLESCKDVAKFYQDNFENMPVNFQTYAAIIDAAISKAEGRG
jgi:hypothetical protein